MSRQRIFEVNDKVRAYYRLLRRNGCTRYEARMMMIGACVSDGGGPFTNKEWRIHRGVTDPRAPVSTEGGTDAD